MFVCNVKCERVREKIQPFTGLNLLYCFWTEIALNHLPQIETLFLFNSEIIYVGCNLIFKGANWLVFVTYLVPLYHLVPLSQFINMYSHDTLNVLCQLIYCLSHALAALTGEGRLWRENSIVGLLS